jgi:hypothetical protein
LFSAPASAARGGGARSVASGGSLRGARGALVGALALVALTAVLLPAASRGGEGASRHGGIRIDPAARPWRRAAESAGRAADAASLESALAGTLAGVQRDAPAPPIGRSADVWREDDGSGGKGGEGGSGAAAWEAEAAAQRAGGEEAAAAAAAPPPPPPPPPPPAAAQTSRSADNHAHAGEEVDFDPFAAAPRVPQSGGDASAAGGGGGGGHDATAIDAAHLEHHRAKPECWEHFDLGVLESWDAQRSLFCAPRGGSGALGERGGPR